MGYRLRLEKLDLDEDRPHPQMVMVDGSSAKETGLVAPCGLDILHCPDPIGFLAEIDDDADLEG